MTKSKLDIDSFPSLEKVEKAISIIKSKTFPKYSASTNAEVYVKNITDIITSELGIIVNYKRPLEISKFLSTFYRVRELNSFTNINLFCEHSYPPIAFTKIGRCNFPKHPVFYCSNDIGTALAEVVRNYNNAEKEYCISKWEVIPSDEQLLFESFMQTILPKENQFSVLKDSLNDKISQPFQYSFGKSLTPDQEQGMIKYLEFLDGTFLNNEDYTISASLAHRSLYANIKGRTDILAYPSAQTMFKGVNFAMQPNFVDNNMKLARLYILKVEEMDMEKGAFKVVLTRYGEVEKNIVMWKKLAPDNAQYVENFKTDFGAPIESTFNEVKK